MVKINEKNVLVIIGPTAVGKSSLGVRLSFLFDAEIVSADSRQIYKYMDIGTAKPDKLDLASIPHHLIDEIRPDEDFNLSLFLRKARKAIDDIHKKGKLPILLGGTGQYIWALLEGWQVPAVAPNIELRSTLEKQARIHGNESLYEELIKLDPGIAKHIDKNNIRRLIRAIEKLKDKNYQAELGNLTLRKDPPAYKLKIIGLNLKRETLYKIADNRVDNMIKQGWIEEVENLLLKGYRKELPSLSSIGYIQIIDYLESVTTLDYAIEQTKYKTHSYIRNQDSWFKKNDSRIVWMDAQYEISDVVNLVNEWLSLK